MHLMILVFILYAVFHAVIEAVTVTGELTHCRGSVLK